MTIGCSWTDKYPDYITSAYVDKRSYHGKGLWFIENKLNEIDTRRYDKIIVQLPTPIRFRASISDTEDSIKEFKLSMMGDDKLLRAYERKILDISQDSRVVFLLYNTGGYPFRHPYDFGAQAEEQVILYMEKNGIQHIKVILEGLHGFTKSYNDFHPNEAADKICAKIVENNIL
jgi:hypothetical protein